MIVSLLCAGPAWTSGAITVLALDPIDGKAVVKGVDGKLHVLKLGDRVPGIEASVRQVLADRLVLEEQAEAGKQLLWVYKPNAAGEASRVERLSRDAGAHVPITNRR